MSQADPGDLPVRNSHLKAKLLRAAHKLVTDKYGVAIGIDEVSLDDVARAAGSSRSAAYRIWPRKEQFVLDVLLQLAGPGPERTGLAAFDEETLCLAESLILENWNTFDKAEQREAVFREVIRLGAQRNLETISVSLEWANYITLMAASLREGTIYRDQLIDALRQSEALFLDVMGTFYEGVMVALGKRIRLGLSVTARDIAAYAAAAIEGLAIRSIVTPSLSAHEVTGPATATGADQWPVASMVFWSIIQQFVEDDPDYDHAKALPAFVKLASRHNLIAERIRNGLSYAELLEDSPSTAGE